MLFSKKRFNRSTIIQSISSIFSILVLLTLTACSSGGGGSDNVVNPNDDKDIIFPSGLSLVKDITVDTHSFPENVVEMGGIYYFTAETAATGREVWRSDGTPEGTWILKDIYAGSSGSNSNYLTVLLGDRLYFSADDGVRGARLWISDGTTEGTQLANKPGEQEKPQHIITMGGNLYFIGSGSNSPSSVLWRTNGIDANNPNSVSTYRIPNKNKIDTNESHSRVTDLIVAGDTLYFKAYSSSLYNQFDLWKSDGSTAEKVIDANHPVGFPAPTQLTANGNGLYFVSTNSNNTQALWRYDGANSSEVKASVTFPDGFTNTTSLTMAGNNLFFVADEGANRTRLWKHDGTNPAVMVIDYASQAKTNPHELKGIGSNLYFSNSQNGTGLEFWVSDSTGTRQVADINPGSQSSYPSEFTAVGSNICFTVHISQPDILNPGSTYYKSELWCSNGTAAPKIITELNSKDYTHPTILNVINNKLIFQKETAQNGLELWSSDGTIANTKMIADINQGTMPSRFREILAVGGTLYFGAAESRGPASTYSSKYDTNILWQSDGTTEGTIPVTNQAGNVISRPEGLLAVGDTLYFTADYGTTGTEIWTTNGAPNSARQVTDIVSGKYGDSYPEYLTVMGGSLYFSAYDPEFGAELWRITGSVTKRVFDIYPGKEGSMPQSLVAGTTPQGQDILYFVADDGVRGRELWKSDGTGENTSIVKDIFTDAYTGANRPMDLTMLGNNLYFTAKGYLWRSDGTTTVVMTDSIDEKIYGGHHLTKVGNTLYFPASTTTSGSGIWKSNGTPAGTVRVKGIENPLEIQPDADAVYAKKFVNNGSTIYAIVTNESGNRQLWETDGSELNTKPIRYDENNIVSNASNLAVVGNTLYFSGRNNESGRELWKYTGVGYAELVVDIAAGVSDSMPRKITSFGDAIFFTADDAQHGRELFRYKQ